MKVQDFSDADLYGNAGEQPGSQAAYERSIEIIRRREMAQRLVDSKVIEAAQAQIDAARSAEIATSASVESARAAKSTAVWTMVSAVAVALTVLVMAVGTYFQATQI